MITNFKIFENINEPQIGDYVILKSDILKNYFILEKNKLKLKKFLDNNIGQVVPKHMFDRPEFIKIAYDVEPDDKIKDAFINNLDINKYCISLGKEHILEFASTPELLKLKIAAKKYNI